MRGQEGGRRHVLTYLGNARGSKEVICWGQHKYSSLKSSKRKGRTNIAKRVLKNTTIQKGDTQIHKYLRLKAPKIREYYFNEPNL